jgi:hypothetical protein
MAAAAILIVMNCVLATAPAGSEGAPSSGCPPGQSPVGSPCVSEGGRASIERFRPVEVIRYVLGSKRMTGYFIDVNGECRVTLMIAEEMDPMVGEPLSAARLMLSMRPGQSASLDSAEAETMLLTCQDAGGAVEIAVRRKSLSAATPSAAAPSIISTR